MFDRRHSLRDVFATYRTPVAISATHAVADIHFPLISARGILCFVLSI